MYTVSHILDLVGAFRLFGPVGFLELLNLIDHVLERCVFGVPVFQFDSVAAVEEAGLTLAIKAPQPQAPSMVAALEQFLAANFKKK